MAKSSLNILTMKNINVQLIQSCIYDKGPISRIDIAAEINASTATVSRIVEDLLQRSIVRNVGLVDAVGAGRKADLLAFNYDFGYVAGVYIRERSVDVAVANLKGTILRHKFLQTRALKDNDLYLEALIGLIREALADLDPGRLMAVSVACFGLVDPQAGTLTKSITLPYRNGLPIVSRLQEAFHIPVYLENDVNMAVVGEYRRRGSTLPLNMAYLEFGAGVGAGILIEGKLYRGSSLGAGEMAYMLTNESQLYESHTENGFMEDHLGSDAIEKYLSKIRLSDPAMLSDSANSGQELKHLLSLYSGNLLVEHLIDSIVNKIAFAVSNFACILNPELIVLGGDYADAWGSFLIRHVQAAVNASFPLAPRIELSRCEQDPELVGAIESAISKLVGSLYLNGASRDEASEFIRPH